MTPVELVLATAAATACLLGGFAIFSPIGSKLRARRHEQVVVLQNYHGRLKLLVSSLLSSANDLDQESKFSSTKLSNEVSQRLARACTDLVALSAAIDAMESTIGRGSIVSCRAMLLRSLIAAEKLAAHLQSIKQDLRRGQLPS
jgi:hypothetical protein